MQDDITSLLDQWGRGDKSALDRLAPAVYPQLRDVAAAYIRGERPGHTLQATALVNELFLKLMARREAHFESRQHFYGVCAKLMRLALIDHARAAKAGKRGGEASAVPLHDELAWVNAAGESMMLDLDRALTELEALDPDQARIFELRFLVGCTADEAAAIMSTSKSTIDRQARIARAWLYLRLTDTSKPDSSPISI